MRTSLILPIVVLAACSPEAGTGNDASNGGAAEPVYDSAYTDLDLDACVVTDESPEGMGASLVCDGFDGMSVYVTDGDGRMDIDAGVANDRFQTMPYFNNPGERVEWRLRDGQAFATIHRIRSATPDAPNATVLVVSRIGTASRPGCVVAFVDATLPGANATARDIADRDAAEFDCSAEPGRA